MFNIFYAALGSLKALVFIITLNVNNVQIREKTGVKSKQRSINEPMVLEGNVMIRSIAGVSLATTK